MMKERILSLKVEPQQAGKTVGQLLRGELHLGQRMLARVKWVPDGICLNGQRVRTNVIVKTGDVLSVKVGDQKTGAYFDPIDCKLDIIYEDEDLLVLNKAAGMMVYAPNYQDKAPTLGNALAFHLGVDAVFHPVNRLDRGTTGLMVVAKSGYVHELLRQMLHSGNFQRQYLAVCCGVVKPAAGRIDLPIGRADDSILRREIRTDGRPAHTEYQRLLVAGDFSLVQLKPQTGRTHQLRLHMASIGYPLVGDWLYGEEQAELIGRPALHSTELWIKHPVSGADLHFKTDLPPDMAKLLQLD